MLFRLKELVRSRLSRLSVSTRFVPEVDGLRFVAIGSVVLYHLMGIISVRQFGKWDAGLFANIWPLNWLSYGHFGVPLFFTISGFVLAMPFAEHFLFEREVLPLRLYYLRRLARLGPPYLLSLLFLFGALLATGRLTAKDWPHLVASACYVHNLVYGSMSTINGVAWSLEVEVQFYLIAPFLGVLFCLRKPLTRRLVLLSLMLGSALAVECFMPAVGDRWDGNVWRMSLLNYTHYFLAGFLLADVYLCDWRGKAHGKRAWLWDLTGLGIWAFIWSNVDGSWLVQILLPFAVFLAYTAAFRGPFMNRFFRTWWVFTIGGMCYTIYLWHQPILMMWGKFGMARTWLNNAPLFVNVFLQFAIGGLLVVAVGAVLFAFTERPFMRKEWYRLRSRSRLATIATPAQPSISNASVSGCD